MTDRKVYEPGELKALLDEAGVPEGDRPRYLLPLQLLLPLLKKEIGPIGKSGQMKPKEGDDKGPRYSFRKIEDILNEGHGPLCALGLGWRKVAVISHELTAIGKAEKCVMTVRYELVGPLGDSMLTEATGEAVDFGSDKATNKADTCARKNMLVDLLQLATEDPDEERPDRVDERPHVQRVSEAQYAEVVGAIKALPDDQREKVKEWAADQGMVVTKAALTRGDYTRLKAFVASRPTPLSTTPAEPKADEPADPEPPQRNGRAATDLVNSEDLAHLSKLMAELTQPERDRIKAERTDLGYSIERGKFTVGTLHWIVGRAAELTQLREATEQALAEATQADVNRTHARQSLETEAAVRDLAIRGLAASDDPTAEIVAVEKDGRRYEPAPGGGMVDVGPAGEPEKRAGGDGPTQRDISGDEAVDRAAARRRAGGVKLAPKAQRDKVAALLAKQDPAVRAEVAQWAAAEGHGLGDALGVDSVAPVTSAITNTARAHKLKAKSTPPGQAAQDAVNAAALATAADPRRTLRADQWTKLMASAEALGVEDTLDVVRQELEGEQIAAPGADLEKAFASAGPDHDAFLAGMVEQYEEIAASFMGRPFEAPEQEGQLGYDGDPLGSSPEDQSAATPTETDDF